MSSSEFKIIKGVLKEYNGNGGDVIIPDSVKKIGTKVFSGRTDILSVVIPKTVSYIGEDAFSDCTSLSRLKIASGVKDISRGAFAKCRSLVSLTMPKSVKHIGVNAFYGCNGLADEHGYIIVRDVLFDCISSESELKVPEGVKIVESVNCPWATSLVLSDGVTDIAMLAFSGCRSLERIVLPDTLTFVGSYAFLFSPLKKIEFSFSEMGINAFECVWKVLDDTQKTNVLTELIKVGGYDALLMGKIKSKKIHLLEFAAQNDDVETIQKVLSLVKAPSLEELDKLIEASVNSTNAAAFLLELKHSTYSAEQQDQAFERKSEIELGLRERTVTEWKNIFLFDKTDKGIVIKSYKGEDLDVVVPSYIGKDPVVKIGFRAFSPDGKNIKNDQRAIRGSITSVTLGSGILEIDSACFYNCTSLKRVVIPESVKRISDVAFWRCGSAIHTQAGTYAEKFAKENRIKLIIIDS